MFEADLWNGDSLSRANLFSVRHYVNSGVQQDCFPAPVQEMPSLRLKGRPKFLLQASGAVYICNGGRKIDRKGTSAGRFP